MELIERGKRMKKVFISIMLLLSLTGCSNKELIEEPSDAIKFKEEYESLNEKTNNSGNKYRLLEIGEDNPFIYKSASDIVEMIDNKETFVVYFGFASCPWCRSIVPSLIEVATDLGISPIYYVNVKEIRDTLELDEEGNIVAKKEGTDAYYQLLEKLDSVLESYLLTDQDDNEIDTGEKRIYAPNIIAIVDGQAIEMTDGISNSQTNAYMELTTEMKQESYNKIKCSIECVADNQKVCSAKTKC